MLALICVLLMLASLCMEAEKSYQEEHPLLEALPRELAEAAEPDKFLWVKHKHDSNMMFACANNIQVSPGPLKLKQRVQPCWGWRGCRCRSDLSSAPEASGSFPSSSWCLGAAAPTPRCLPVMLPGRREDHLMRPMCTPRAKGGGLDRKS